jgi:hypothetical protein
VSDVDREAVHDWLDQRDSLDDERPTATELAADAAERTSYPRTVRSNGWSYPLPPHTPSDDNPF